MDSAEKYLTVQINPHMRGDTTKIIHSGGGHFDRPPHMWGESHRYYLGAASDGSTPTEVGKTRAIFYATLAHDQPPHAWGKLIFTSR